MSGVHVRSWLNAVDAMKSARNKDNGKPLGVQTRLVVSRNSPKPFGHDETVYAVQYWYTEVIRFYPSGLIGVNLDDHDSKTTKMRVREFSGVSIWGRKGTTFIVPFGHHDITAPMDTTKEYFVDAKNRTLISPDGFVYDKSLELVALPKPLPKSRNPAANPLLGDVLVNSAGEHYIVAKKRQFRTSEVELRRYYGDDPIDRRYCHLDSGAGLDISPMFLLASEHSWKPAERFERQMKKAEA